MVGIPPNLLARSLITLDESGRITSANDAAASLFGHAHPDELIGRALHESFTPADRAQLARGLVMDHSFVARSALRTGDNREIEVCVSVNPPAGQQPRTALIRPLETTCPLLKALDELEASHDELLESLQVGILIQGPSAEMLRWNQKALDLLGLTEGQLTGRTSFDPRWNVIHQDGSDFPGPTHPVPVAIATREPVRGVTMGVYRPAIGDRVWLLVDAQPRLDDSGEVVDVVCTFTDMTEQKRLSDEIARAQRHEVVSRLAGSLAHDFNNMLAVIMATADSKLRDPGASREGLGEILDAAERGAQLTNRLLTLAGRSVEQIRRIAVDPFIEQIGPLVERAVGERIEVELALGAPSAALAVAPSRFEQALLNLAFNARDAMVDGGALRIQTEMCDGGSDVRITVTDTGAGIPDEIAGSIFEPFITTKGGQGTGLGLTSVKDLVDSLGGSVTFETSPRGTSFALVVPTSLGRVEPPAPAKVAPEVDGQRLLVVDNDPSVRRALSEALRAAGHEVMVAADCPQALQVIRENPIDLLITDVVMPRIDGVSLSARARDVVPSLPVLYVSGYVGSFRDELGQLDERTRFLAKPFRVNDLLAVIAELVGDRAEAQPPPALEEDEPLTAPAGNTVLVIDDTPLVIRGTVALLTSAGYRCLEAGSATTARALVADFGADIDVILCDVFLGDALGPELVQSLRADCAAPVVYMTGRASSADLPEGSRLISKPFLADTLLEALADALGAR